MNEIIKVNYESDRPTVLARDLHQFLEVGSEFSHWFKRMCEYGFSEGTDFSPFLTESSGGRPAQDAQLTIEMAKEICMIQRNEKGKQARQYFINIEKEWNSPERIMARALQIANKTIHQLEEKVAEDKPKVDFYNDVTSSGDAIEIGEVAKLLDMGVGRNKLFSILREEKILMRDNILYQEFVDRGYFEVIETRYQRPNGDVGINLKTLVFQRGVDYIRKVLNERGMRKRKKERKRERSKYESRF